MPLSDYAAIPTPYEFPVPPQQTNNQIPPALGNAHQWVCTAIFTVSQAAVDHSAAAWMAGHPAPGIELDHENLTSVQGPACLKCHQDLTPQTHARPCPVQIVPVLNFTGR
jgi:hypothetical protein